MNARLVIIAALLVTLAPHALPQGSGNLVQNGGFEAGDFTGWTLTGSPADTFVSLGFPHSGTRGAVFGAVDTAGYISQTLPSSAGETYLLSFWVASGDNGGGTPNEFIVQWGGNTLLDRSDMVIPVWTNMQFIVAAPSSSTVLAFGGWDNQDYILLDDISVTIPGLEPAFQVVTKTNNVITFTWSTAAGQVYQVQYKTNLSQSAWSELASPATATTATMSASDVMGTDLQRFYRIVLLR